MAACTPSAPALYRRRRSLLNNNDVLRGISQALSLTDMQTVEIFALVEHEITPRRIRGLIVEEGATVCSDERLGMFLDGLIALRRGPRDPNLPERPQVRLNNNEVLKKLRIAMNLQEVQMLEVFALGGDALTKTDVSALFRKRGNKHYRQCTDAVLTQFMAGLAVREQNATSP